MIPRALRTHPALLGCVVCALSACAASARVLSAPVARGGAAVPAGPRAEAERLWLERGDEGRLREAIAAWRRAVASKDDDAAAWLGLAHAEFFLADGFLAFDPARAGELAHTFEDGAAHAERGLRALSRAFEARRQAGADVDQAALGLEPQVTAALGPEGGRRLLGELLYWWGANLIRWADLRGRLTAMNVYRSVNRAIEAAGRLDPTIDHGGPDRYFGSFYAEAPGIAGGDLEKSKAAFARAVALAPLYLETRVHLAAHYARRAGAEALYAESLRVIAETPATALPDAVPEQEVAKKKARRLPPAL